MIVVGDRIFTDVVLANRMTRRIEKRSEKEGPLSIWTEGVWERESMVLRGLERRIMELARRWVNRKGTTSDGNAIGMTPVGYETFVRELPPPQTLPMERKSGLLSRVWNSIRGV